jgi:hypothetical protein
MILRADGNVGIGTTNPSQTLDVESTSTVVSEFNSTNASNSAEIHIRTNGGTGNNTRSRIVAGFQSGGSSFGGFLAFNTTSTQNINNEHMRITNDGKVGIGTASPGVKLDVEGSGRFNGTFTETTTTQGAYIGYLTTPRILFANGTAAQNWQIDNSAGNFRWFLPGSARMTLSTEALTLDHATSGILRALGSGNSYFTGNLGIGTATPAEKLAIVGTQRIDHTGANGGTALRINRTDNTAANGAILFSGQNTLRAGIATSYGTSDANGNLEFIAGGNTKALITSTGNLGLGTTSPAQKLEVAGNTKTQDLIISDTSNVAKATMSYDSTSKSIKFVFA